MGELWTDHVSFSQLTSVETCPYQWFLLKVASVEPVDNCFSQAGTLAHQILADWAQGKITKGEMCLQWIKRFPVEVTAEFPRYLAAKGYGSKLFDSVLRYFEGFDGFPDYEIVGVEQEFTSMLAGERFVGVIDLILRDKATGGLMIVDHKSASLSTFRKSKDKMYRQLLLYSKYVADNYGAFPEKLAFNLFKEGVMDVRPFTSEDYMAARLWAEKLIIEMKEKELTDWFETKPEFFNCTNLCSCRHECIFGKEESHRKKEKKNGLTTAA